jgi:CBS domain containing-hemolysin-like protein
MAAFGRSAEFFLWLVATLSLVGLVLIVAMVSWWAVLIVILAAKSIIWQSRSPKSYDGWQLSLSAVFASIAAPVVSFLMPILGRVVRGVKSYGPLNPSTRIYEKEDLLDLLRLQARQPDNRIEADDLKTARGALSLSDKKVGDIMLPRRKARGVAGSEPIGPLLMDELHQTGQTRFLVVKEAIKSGKPEIVGTLYLKDLLDNLETKGRVRNLMHPGVSYINESQNLLEAVNGFLKSGHYVLVVVDNFEEFIGILTLEDVLHHIFGSRIDDEFDRYHDARSVASVNNHQSSGEQTEAKVN